MVRRALVKYASVRNALVKYASVQYALVKYALVNNALLRYAVVYEIAYDMLATCLFMCVYKRRCRNSGTGQYETITMGFRWTVQYS